MRVDGCGLGVLVPGDEEAYRVEEDVDNVDDVEAGMMASLASSLSSSGVGIPWLERRRTSGGATNIDDMKNDHVLEVGNGEESLRLKGIELEINGRDVPNR